jgi:ubiquinone/menaquinone biosynthesis C-methylase UbiE
MFMPHWKHYERLGAVMRAVDVVADSTESRIEVGDARLLKFPKDSFDFLTVPMLLGPGNSCCTGLEITFCLSEMRRVLKRSGFVHIADNTFHPSVCFCAGLTGFRVTFSKNPSTGLPIGTFLFKDSEPSKETLDRFPELSALPTVSLSPTTSEVVRHCNLAYDPLPPVVRPGSIRCEPSAVA